MKKNLFYLFVVLFAGLFAACTQSESPLVQNEESQVVRISTQLPQDFAAATRAVTVPAGHQLRYILEVWNEAGTALVGERQVKLMSSISNASFDLTLDNGTYQFVLWADFVNTSGNEVYYNVADLKAITLKDAAMTYNNEAAAAFCFIETRQKEANTQLQVSATLKRAVALLTVKEKGTIPTGTKVAASHSIPTTLNMLTGVISGSATAALSATDPADAASKALFTQYILTSAASATSTNDALGVINLTFTGGASRTVAIPANQPIKRNHRTNLNGYLVAANATNTTVTANVSDVWDGNDQGGDVEPTEPQAAMKVGDYIYKDGSYSSTYDAGKAIAIVFALPEGTTDNSNYGSNFTGKTIKGYAMGLSSVARTALNKAGASEGTFEELPTLANTSTDTSAPWIIGDYNGYQYSTAFESAMESYGSPLLAAYATWKTNNAFDGSITNVSPWYIPSSRQLADLIGVTYGYDGQLNDQQVASLNIPAIAKNNAVSDAVANVRGSETTTSYFGGYSGTCNIISSFIRGGRFMSVQTSYSNPIETINQFTGITVRNTSASPFAIRPVITIFE